MRTSSWLEANTLASLLICTRERIAALWDQLAEFPALRALMDMGTEARFWRRLEDPHTLLWEVSDGLVAALDVQPHGDATVYFLAWDHHLAGKEPQFHEALGEVFRVGQLRRVTMRTPSDMAVLIKLARRLGFTWEGVLRHGWNDLDVHLNGLLREEWDHGLASRAA